MGSERGPFLLKIGTKVPYLRHLLHVEAIVCLGERLVAAEMFLEDAGTHLERSQSEQSHLATQNLDNRDTSLFRMTSKSSKSLIPKPDLF